MHISTAQICLQILQHLFSAGSPPIRAAERTGHVPVGASGHAAGGCLRGRERGAASHRVQNKDNGIHKRGVGWDQPGEKERGNQSRTEGN